MAAQIDLSSTPPSESFSADAKIKRTFIGHKGRIFHLNAASEGNSLLSSSEDGTCKIWDLANRKCTATLVHNRDAEALRATFFPDTTTICTGGSDGAVCVWRQCISSGVYSKAARLEHGEEAQIYACESIASSSSGSGNEAIDLLTAADNRIFIWDLNRTEHPTAVYDFHRVPPATAPNENLNANQPNSNDSSPISSHKAAPESEVQAFGGHRNPNDLVFVFDAKSSPMNSNIISAAMSDATIRLIDIRSRHQPSQVSLDIAGSGSSGLRLGHATSVSWSGDTNTLLVALGCGRIAVLDTRMSRLRNLLSGHQGPCYGALFPPHVEHQHQCISWSSDSSVCLWDVNTGALRKHMRMKDYQILHAVWSPTVMTSSDDDTQLPQMPHLLCGGGSGSSAAADGEKKRPWNSFIGVPLYEIDIVA